MIKARDVNLPSDSFLLNVFFSEPLKAFPIGSFLVICPQRCRVERMGGLHENPFVLRFVWDRRMTQT